MANPAGELADVDQAILMDADIHKYPEIDDISYRPLKLHTRLKILCLHDIGA